MNSTDAIACFLALGQTTRLDAYRLLVEHEPDGLPVTEIASRLSVNITTLSRHLAQLQRAGLLRSYRRERQVFYCCNVSGLLDLVSFLTENCCRANPDACRPSPKPNRKSTRAPRAKKEPVS